MRLLGEDHCLIDGDDPDLHTGIADRIADSSDARLHTDRVSISMGIEGKVRPLHSAQNFLADRGRLFTNVFPFRASFSAMQFLHAKFGGTPIPNA